MTDLTKKKCEPCEGKGNPFSAEQAKPYLAQISDWVLSEDGKWISRDYVMKNFVAGVEFIRKVADIAEAENHHPDIHLTGYKKVRIELSTHAIGGLSENDFIVAAKINELM